MNKENNYIKIFDTTLRDGEQSPGASMNIEEKLKIAEALEDLKVDIIEAGFPAASKGDYEAVSEISKKIKNSSICALSRASKNDIQTAADALASGESATDVFTYTITDANSATATATLTITVLGVNDNPVAQNDVGVIVENGTLTVANGANANVSGSYDATGEYSGDVINTSSSSHSDSDLDTSDSLNITQIKKNGGTNSAVSSGSS